ncbi:hypothetical protein IMY05_C4631000200 [Salix suchowensis]|nr:hypothetical protein IMY05_C4631000200 [Salix suchowensis]
MERPWCGLTKKSRTLRTTVVEFISLYDLFMQPTAIQDATEELLATGYSPMTSVCGFYDALEHMAKQMIHPPDHYMFRQQFVMGLPMFIRDKMVNQGYNTENYPILDLYSVALQVEESRIMAKHYTHAATANKARNHPGTAAMATKALVYINQSMTIIQLNLTNAHISDLADMPQVVYSVAADEGNLDGLQYSSPDKENRYDCYYNAAEEAVHIGLMDAGITNDDTHLFSMRTQDPLTGSGTQEAVEQVHDRLHEPGLCMNSESKVWIPQRHCPLQLGTVGSSASIQFGAYTQALFGSIDSKEYFNIGNIDHYNIILGTSWMHKHRVSLILQIGLSVLVMKCTLTHRGGGISGNGMPTCNSEEGMTGQPVQEGKAT